MSTTGDNLNHYAILTPTGDITTYSADDARGALVKVWERNHQDRPYAARRYTVADRAYVEFCAVDDPNLFYVAAIVPRFCC